MAYKPILHKEHKEGDQCVIEVDDNTYFKSNLDENEIIIENLYSKSCPINRNCIEYIEEDRLSLFCEHFGNLFQITPSQFSYESLFCEKDKMYHEVFEIKPLTCPIARYSCQGCKKLINIIAKPYPQKSHCHVVCE